LAPKFGTSGLRGLVSELTPERVAAHVRAFLAVCDTGDALCLGRDLRPSSPRITGDVVRAATAAGLRVIDCGALPTPALALAAARARAAAIMVTGSHIPADRNGLKFYSRGGIEITKAEEAAIRAALSRHAGGPVTSGSCRRDDAATARYVARYARAFGASALAGRRIGIFEHSAVGRDALREILGALGAEVVPLGRANRFVAVDTEAVDPQVAARIRDWVLAERLDALVSTDGDSDRPLLADETGRIVPGDILGQITAEMLGAHVVVTPVSSNSGVLAKGFAEVRRTKIGSPFVIAGMAQAARAVGYEANGGVLLGFEAQGPAGPLAPLPTRDGALPLLCVLTAAGDGPLSARIAAEPAIFTATDRLPDIPGGAAQALVAELAQDAGTRAAFLQALGADAADAPDLTDGLRMPLTGGRTLHVRPSGNAPELRLYAEARSPEAAARLLAAGLAQVRARLGA
jgi:phosphomannomutase